MALEIKKVTSDTDYQRALAVRQTVFVEEQGVPWAEEIDQYEHTSVNFIGLLEGQVVVTGRYRQTEDGVKIERVATLPKFRGQGLGQHLMAAMEQAIAAETHPGPLYLHSQVSAVSFYEKIGWVAEGDVFYECDIGHRKMTKPCR